MRATDTDSFLVESWESAMKQQRLRKATESQSIDLTLLASTPMHDRLTFERSEAVDEKIEERLRKDGPVNLYQGWMEEIEDKVAQHKGGRGDKSPTKSKKVIKIPHVTRCVYIPCLPPDLLSQAGQIPGKGLMLRAHARLQHGNNVHSAYKSLTMRDCHFSEAMTTINDTQKYKFPYLILFDGFLIPMAPDLGKDKSTPECKYNLIHLMQSRNSITKEGPLSSFTNDLSVASTTVLARYSPALKALRLRWIPPL